MIGFGQDRFIGVLVEGHVRDVVTDHYGYFFTEHAPDFIVTVAAIKLDFTWTQEFYQLVSQL